MPKSEPALALRPNRDARTPSTEALKSNGITQKPFFRIRIKNQEKKRKLNRSQNGGQKKKRARLDGKHQLDQFTAINQVGCTRQNGSRQEGIFRNRGKNRHSKRNRRIKKNRPRKTDIKAETRHLNETHISINKTRRNGENEDSKIYQNTENLVETIRKNGANHQFGEIGKIYDFHVPLDRQVVENHLAKTRQSNENHLGRTRLNGENHIGKTRRNGENENSEIQQNTEKLVQTTRKNSENHQTDESKQGKESLETYKREYIVEKILAHVVRDKKQLFLVKWQGWSESYNSWEPLEHLTHCERLLEDFLADSLQQPVLDELQSWLQIEQPTVQELNEALPTRGGIRALPLRTQVQRELMAIAATPAEKRPHDLREHCKRILFQYWTLVQRDKQVVSLRYWEEEMNGIACESAVLTVENNVDLEGSPAGFIYINHYIAGEGVVIPDDPPIGCECQKCNGRSQNCCFDQSYYAYRKRGRINVPQGTPVYECNKRCKCNPATCNNRVVQIGRRVPLCIFRTSDGRGWGVRTLRRVFAGEFVCEYVGEVVSFDEAERRGHGYDAEGRTYLFDLDFNSHDFPYTVDAATYGNVSHFINHSCEPNLGVWAVWVNCLDPNIPRLALFATRDIAKFEEITFDYMCNAVRQKRLGTSTSARPRLALDSNNCDELPRCKCAAPTCRQYLF